MKKFKKTKAITECICCGGTNLTHVDIDPETVDVTMESVSFSTGYHCPGCGNISHTDGEEVSFTIMRELDIVASSLSLSGSKTESYWPSHSKDPRAKKELA